MLYRRAALCVFVVSLVRIALVDLRNLPDVYRMIALFPGIRFNREHPIVAAPIELERRAPNPGHNRRRIAILVSGQPFHSIL